MLAAERSRSRDEFVAQLGRSDVRICHTSFADFARSILAYRPTVIVCISDFGEPIELERLIAVSFATPMVIIGADPGRERRPLDFFGSVVYMPMGFSTEQQALLTVRLAHMVAAGDPACGAAQHLDAMGWIQESAPSSALRPSVSLVRHCSAQQDGPIDEVSHPVQSEASRSTSQDDGAWLDDDSCEKTLPSVTSYVRPARLESPLSTTVRGGRGRRLISALAAAVGSAVRGVVRSRTYLEWSRRAIHALHRFSLADAESPPETKRV